MSPEKPIIDPAIEQAVFVMLNLIRTELGTFDRQPVRAWFPSGVYPGSDWGPE